jgi:hypothetical protein
MALLTANVLRSTLFIFLAYLSGITRLLPSDESLHVGMDPRATLVPNPERPVVTQAPVPATVLIDSVGVRIIRLIRQYVLSAMKAEPPSG